jgi:NADH:ubiquinone oxidoreductase subunit F (NADH-binding)
VLLGGFAGGIRRPDALDTAASHDALREHGALLGCGAMVLVEDDDCPVAAAADAASYLAASSAGQCGACVRGTRVSAEQLVAIARGVGTPENLAILHRRTAALPGRGNCALPDALATLLRTLAAHFGDELDAHLNGACAVCVERVATRIAPQTRFRVRFPD